MNYPIIIGGSAGSFSIILRIIPVLKHGFKFPLIFCLHRHKTSTSNFIPALEKNKTIKVMDAEDNDLILPGRVYVAPADKHLAFSKDNSFVLLDDPPMHYSRPSIDYTMKSAAEIFRDRVVGILLTGANADGAEGMKAIHEAGGITIVQDPEDAEISVMPQAAIDCFQPTHVLSADKIISFIENLSFTD